MNRVRRIQRHLELGGQVMGAEYIQVGVQDFTGYPIIRQFKTQSGDFGGAEVVVALGTPQLVARQLFRHLE